MTYKIIHNDCLIAMKEMEDNSIDFIVTDPPYGISFMGKKWDYGIPNEEYWREMLRILKPGSHLAAMGGSRTFHRLTSKIEDSGFEIRDCIMWLYGSGFPKSHNNFGSKGYGTALKPSYEPIIIAMKPLEGTYKQNFEKWGVGGINIDGCRIRTDDNICIPTGNQNNSIYKSGLSNYIPNEKPIGRWPANLILDEESAEQLDQMTGISKSSNAIRKNNRPLANCLGKYNPDETSGYSDSGGCSRFFYCAKASSSERNKGLEGMPLKESSGCYGEFEGDGRGRQTEHSPRQNTHPTVKPISLMKYIITLLAPPGSPILLDPFCGSGSTICAAKELGISAIGIEKEKEYVEIATKRVDAAQYTSQKQMEMFN